MKTPQHAIVLAHLRNGYATTNLDAARMWKITRLGDVIFKLRKKATLSTRKW